MAKSKPATTPEEAATVPLDKPVTIEIETPPAPTLPEGVEAQGELPLTPPAEKPEAEPEPDADALRKQLDELRTAETAAKQQAAEARQREEDALRRASEHQQELLRERGRSQQAEYESVVNAINAFQAEADKAQSDLEASLAANDPRGAADAQRRLSTATARLVQLEDGKAAYEARIEYERQNPPRLQQPSSDPVDAMTHLSGKQRDWLKNHRDALTDPAKNAYLGAAHHDALRAGHAVDSDGYYQMLEEKLGYRKPADSPATTERRPPVSAPVSREAPSLTTGKPSTSRIELTPEMREAAKISGIDEVTYAKNYARLLELKKQGHYQERG